MRIDWGFKVLTAAVLVLGCLGLSSPASALDRYERQVVQQLREAAENLRDDGWRKTFDYFTDKIRRGRTETYTVTLEAKESYLIIAFCDTDCDDVDLRLYDSRGREVDEDVERDDYPVVTVDTGGRERYKVEAWIPGCYARRCTIGIGVFRQR